MTVALEGVRVLDFGQGLAGPYCAQLLGDHGAQVIKVEPPRGDWSRTMGVPDEHGETGAYLSVNRNKRGISLDLKRPAALEIARDLALKADVIVESFRPGVMDRMGLGYDDLRAKRPQLVYCDITGFGRSGPNVNLPASDSVMQPYGGLMAINGERDGEPLRIGNFVADMVAGANAFGGVLLALLARAVSGKGRRVSVSLLDSIVAFQGPPLTEYLKTGKEPRRLGNDHPMTTPSGVFKTADGAISLTVMAHKWPAFCAGLGVAEAADDPRFLNMGARHENRDSLRQLLTPVFMNRTSAEWIGRLREMDILCAPINDYPSLVKDVQIVHNETIRWEPDTHGHKLPMLSNPVRLEDEPLLFGLPPRFGEHTREVLTQELGFSDDEIDAMQSNGAVHATQSIPAS